MWNQAVSFFKRTKILGTACEFGLSLISMALSQCMSHLGLNTNISITFVSSSLLSDMLVHYQLQL